MSLHDEVERHFRAEARKAKKAGRPKPKSPNYDEDMSNGSNSFGLTEYEQELREIEELQEMEGIANKARKLRNKQ